MIIFIGFLLFCRKCTNNTKKIPLADYKTNLNYKSSGWFFCAIYTKMEKRERGVKG